jgi:hypothetical protein
MDLEKMELKIYQEYADKVQRGEYNGISLLNDFQTGGYLQTLSCKELDPEAFHKVSLKVKKNMLDGIKNEISNAPFFVRGSIRNASYGESILSVNVNHQVVKTVNLRIDQLKKTLKQLNLLNLDFLRKLSFKNHEKKDDGKSRGMDLG